MFHGVGVLIIDVSMYGCGVIVIPLVLPPPLFAVFSYLVTCRNRQAFFNARKD